MATVLNKWARRRGTSIVWTGKLGRKIEREKKEKQLAAPSPPFLVFVFCNKTTDPLVVIKANVTVDILEHIKVGK